MKKYLFFLLFSVPLFFGATSCGKQKKCQDMKTPIAWKTTGVHFKTVTLSINKNYYRIDDGALRVGPGKPITTFYDIFRSPVYENTPIIEFNSHIDVHTFVNENCLKTQDDYNNSHASQIYKNHEKEQQRSSTPRMTSTPVNVMEMHNGKTYFCKMYNAYLNGMHVWQSTRGGLNHSCKIEIQSGTYKGVDGRLYNLIWSWSCNLKDFAGDKMEDFIDVNASSNNQDEVLVNHLIISGAAKDVTPNRPFDDRLYIDGAVIKATLENVQVANKETMALEITR